MADLETALAVSGAVDNAVKALNAALATAATAGLQVDIETYNVRQIEDAVPRMFVSVKTLLVLKP